MTQPTLDLILHPVRLRLLLLLNRHAPATATQLADQLADVNRRTLYRHLDELLTGGMIRVARTQQVRGTVERYFELARPAVLDVAELNALPPEEGKRLLTYIVSLLQAEFFALLEQSPESKRLADSYLRIGAIVVSPTQMQKLVGELLERAAEMEANPPADEEQQTYRISLIAFPVPEARRD